MKYFTNKKTNEVYGYESIEDAKKFNDGFKNLVEMTDEQFIQFRDHRPKGGQWTAEGWAIDDDLLAQEIEAEEQRKIQSLHDDLDNIERQITRLERIKERTKEENEELDRLIDEATGLYRVIKELDA